MSRAASCRFWLMVFVFGLAVSGFAQNQSPRPASSAAAVEELATALVTAKTEEERTALLVPKKELQTPALVQALLRLGNRWRTRLDSLTPEILSEAVAIFQLAQRIAEQLEDKAGEAGALRNLGDVIRAQGGNAISALGKQNLALKHYRKSLALFEDVGDKAGMANVRISIGYSYIVLGEFYRDQKNYGAATEAYQEALTLFETVGNQTLMSNILLFIGHCYSAQEDFASALVYYKKSLILREMQSDWMATATAQCFMGDTYRLQKNYSRALEAYQKSLTIFEAMADKAGIARVLSNLEPIYSSQGKDHLAREAKRRSQAIDEELRQTKQNAAGDIRAILMLTERIVAAETDEEKATLLNAERTLATRELAQNLLLRGAALSNQFNYSKAISIYRLVVEIGKQVGDKIVMANALSSIGAIYLLNQNNPRKALEYYQKSLALWEKVGIPKGIAESLHNFGQLYSKQQNFGLALWYYRKARAVAEAAESIAIANLALLNMGPIYARIGDYDHALECLKLAVEVNEAVENRFGVANAMHHYFVVYAQQGQFEMARLYTQRAGMIFEDMGQMHEVAHQWNDLADLYRLQGNYLAAIQHYRKSIEQLEGLGDNLRLIAPYQGLAETCFLQGDYQQALQLTQVVATLFQPSGYTATHISSNIGTMSSPHYISYSHIGTTSSSYLGLTIAGKSYRALNQPAQSRAAFDEAIAIIETLRTQLLGREEDGQHFFEDKLSPYHEMTSLLVSQQQAAAALGYAERAKARTLLDVLRNGRSDVAKAMTIEEQAQEQRLRNDLILVNAEVSRERQRKLTDPARLANLQSLQQKARQTFETFQAGLYATHPVLKIQRGEAPVLRPEEIAALMPDAQTALLEFVVAEEKAFLFAITKNKIGQPSDTELNVYSLAITAKELSAQVEDFRQQLAKRSPDFSASARELYGLLLKPAAAQLQGKTSLVIVPDGPLWELPFQALQPSATRFLIEDFSISYAPSLTALREMTRARKKPSGRQSALLALGNPALDQETISRAKYVLMDEKLDPLPEAEAQVKTLGRLYGSRQSKIYTGAEAREERAKAEAGKYRILHLATHGVLNDASPMYSHLLLSQTGEPGKDAQEDGLLEAWELMKLDLNADLVVLSACETARGRVGAGEGVIGLTWALFVAGCPRTVVSQWKVEAASTTELMVEFHRQLKTRMQNPKYSFGAAQSLRTAALKMLRSEKYRHPFWWAGFVVIGDGF